MQEWGFILCLRFRIHFFRLTKFLRFKILKKILIWILRFHRKMCRLFPCITIFKWFFFIKSAKRMCICDYVKNHIGTCEKCIFWCEKGYKWISVLGSPKTYCWIEPRELLLQHWLMKKLDHSTLPLLYVLLNSLVKSYKNCKIYHFVPI